MHFQYIQQNKMVQVIDQDVVKSYSFSCRGSDAQVYQYLAKIIEQTNLAGIIIWNMHFEKLLFSSCFVYIYGQLYIK